MVAHEIFLEMSNNNIPEEGKKSSALDELIQLLPFELHVPGYKFCGPGTKLAERIASGEVGINPLDKACQQHDIAYADKTINNQQADRVLAEKAFSRVLADDTPSDERTLALMTTCCMVSKITIEKIFSRINKVIRKKKNKKRGVKIIVK